MSRDNILNNLKDNISVSKFRREKARKDKIRNVLQSTFAVVLCMFSITGIVFARDISTKVYENFFYTGNGMGHAIEEGYIEKPEMEPENAVAVIENEETGEKIEDLETSVKVDELVMDDFNLSITFNVTLSEKVSEIVNAEDIYRMDFTDMVISDENDYILYFGQEKYKDFDIEDEKVINTGINPFIKSKDGNTIKVIYNIYTGSAHFPKSKELNFELHKMNMTKVEGGVATIFGDGEYTITGDWNFKVDVPEKMYNRQTTEYVQKSTTNPKFNVTEAVVYETGTEVYLELKDAVGTLPERPTLPELEFYNSLPDDSEFKGQDSQISIYLSEKLFSSDEYREYDSAYQKIYDVEVYLLNENNEKFEFTMGPRENGGSHIEDDGTLITNAMYDLTKHDMTDEITVVVERDGKEEQIVLVKKGEE